jgi:hypothetical protein
MGDLEIWDSFIIQGIALGDPPGVSLYRQVKVYKSALPGINEF